MPRSRHPVGLSILRSLAHLPGRGILFVAVAASSRLALGIFTLKHSTPVGVSSVSWSRDPVGLSICALRHSIQVGIPSTPRPWNPVGLSMLCSQAMHSGRDVHMARSWRPVERSSCAVKHNTLVGASSMRDSALLRTRFIVHIRAHLSPVHTNAHSKRLH